MDDAKSKKAAKAAKLKEAREKAKRWAQEQKSGKTKTKSKSVKAPERRSVAPVVADDEISALTYPTVVSTKRKRVVQDSDEESTGPFGTPKARKPTRKKKVPNRASPDRTYMDIDPYTANSNVEPYPDNDVEMEPIKTSKKTSAAKVDKKEKLRLAREKAAKWANKQKSPKSEQKATKKPIQIDLKDMQRASQGKSKSMVRSTSAPIPAPKPTPSIRALSPVPNPPPASVVYARVPAPVVYAPTPSPVLNQIPAPIYVQPEFSSSDTTILPVLSNHLLSPTASIKPVEVNNTKQVKAEETQVFYDANTENENMEKYNEKITEILHQSPTTYLTDDAESKPSPAIQEEPESLVTKTKNIITLTCQLWIFVLLFFSGILFTFTLIDVSSAYWSHFLFRNSTSTNNTLQSLKFSEVNLEPEVPNPDKSVAPPCFESTIQTPDQDNLEVPPHLLAEGITQCDKSRDPLSCPQGGICFGGYLQTCFPGEMMEVNSSHDGCGLTVRGEETLILVKNRLIKMTLEQMCGCMSFGNSDSCLVKKSDVIDFNGDDNPDLSSSVLFNVDSLCNSLDLSKRTLIALSHHWPKNDIYYERNSTSTTKNGIIGLSSDFLQGQLPIPPSCYFRLFFSSFVSFLCSTLFSTFLACFNFCLHCLLTYPIPTLTTICSVYIVHALQRRRKRTQVLRTTTRDIREKAYEKLRLRGTEKYGEQHLRDDIAHEMYPDNLKRRKKFMAEIWPRVSVEVRCDSRVTRSYKSGMEWWEWADRISGTAPTE